MTEIRKTYNLSNIKQLIDLNGDSINFDLTFKVTCKDNTPFQLLVVDQTTLDKGEELKYKEITNNISGNIVADKNVYQNYFLILKSEKNCTVDIEIIKKELPKTPDNINLNLEPKKSSNLIIQQDSSSSTSYNWKKIFLIMAIVVVSIFLIRYLYNNYNKPKTTDLSSQFQTLKNKTDLSSQFQFIKNKEIMIQSPLASLTENKRDFNSSEGTGFTSRTIPPPVSESMKEGINQETSSPKIVSNELVRTLREQARPNPVQKESIPREPGLYSDKPMQNNSQPKIENSLLRKPDSFGINSEGTDFGQLQAKRTIVKKPSVVSSSSSNNSSSSSRSSHTPEKLYKPSMNSSLIDRMKKFGKK